MSAVVESRIARALGLTQLDRSSVAEWLGHLASERAPAHAETRDFLIRVFQGAISQIPTGDVAWSWGEFHNAGIEAVFELDRDTNSQRLAVCAADLALDDQPPLTRSGQTGIPREALSRSLMAATERLLLAIRERLEAGGISPHQPSS